MSAEFLLFWPKCDLETFTAASCKRDRSGLPRLPRSGIVLGVSSASLQKTGVVLKTAGPPSLPRARRCQSRNPLFDIGVDEAGEFPGRAANRICTLPL